MERGTDVHIWMPVLQLQNRRAVRIVEHVLHPDELKRIEVQAHEVAAVVADDEVLPPDDRRSLHADPVLLPRARTGIAPAHRLVR